jgi:hypothetical protein
MGGEHASTTRMRLAGQICCACKLSLPAEPNQKPGERYCARCEPPRHRVLMQFMMAKGGWSVSFLEEDCKTSLPRRFTFQSELKILDLARHGGAEFNLAGRQAIEHGISMGRGSVWLSLTTEQSSKLRR